jgi:hypothetical protein
MNNIYTTDECKSWNKNKLVNPKTLRPIKENAPLYNKIKKLCSNKKTDSYSIFNDFCNTYKIKSTDNLNSTDKKIYRKFNEFCYSITENLKDIKTDIRKEHKQKDIKTDIKKEKKEVKFRSVSSSSSKDNTIIFNKFNDYKKISKYLETIEFKSKNCITLTSENNNYLLTKDIKLYQQIGSPSVFGIIYKAMNINDKYKSIPKFVVKIQLQSKEAQNELTIFKALSKYAIKYKIIHLPLYYFDSICDKIIREPAYPTILRDAKKINKNYSIILYERAFGDLKTFMNNEEHNEDIWKNIYEQIFMSIFILHNLGYLHNDTHWGNFLYYKIKKGGCFHYKINDENYYIENIGILWMIWDFGNVKSSKLHAPYAFLNDYYKINVCLCHKNSKLESKKEFINNLLVKDNMDGNGNVYSGILKDKINVPSNIKKIQKELWEKFININPDKYLTMKAQAREVDDYSFLKLLKDEKILFSKSPIGEVISSISL